MDGGGMNEFQRNVAMAQQAEQQYRAWAAAQGGPTPSYVDPAVVAERAEAERRREERRVAVAELLPRVGDPIERLLVAMSTLTVGDAVPSFGNATVDFLIGPWEAQLRALHPGLSGEYDSHAIAAWFVSRAAAVGLPTVTFEPVVERKRLFGGYVTVRQPGVRAWAFDRAIERRYRGERISAAPLFILEDGRMLAPMSSPSGMDAPSIVIRELPPVILVKMADVLGLGPNR